MSDEEETTMPDEGQTKKKVAGKAGQVTLTQMLKALDNDVASKVEKRLKKLSKKKAVEAPLDDLKAAQVERKNAYQTVSKEIGKWDLVVEKNKQGQLRFPLDEQPNVLPTAAESVAELNPRNELEREIQLIIKENEAEQAESKKLTRAEEKYLKAVSVEEAKERHLELQKMRVLLNSYGAKMRRQKLIKSKSYRKLLKQERIKKHVKRVESDKDALLDEIERLQKIRAQERASLKHKNTGKWAKHAKFRAKYDEEARQAMLEQIGLAKKLREKPALPETDSEEDDDDDEDSISESSSEEEEASDVEAQQTTRIQQDNSSEPQPDRLIISSELLDSSETSRKRKPSSAGDTESEDGDEDEEDEQRKLMSEAFADDDVVEEFKKTKSKMADEEQPKDVNLYLPGWNDWAGPGIKKNRHKQRRYRIKAKKVKRTDESLSNVIISERANDAIKELQVKKLPRGIKNDDQFAKVLSKPIASTFTDQTSHRKSIEPKIVTKLGARIEPINKRVLTGGNKAKWA